MSPLKVPLNVCVLPTPYWHTVSRIDGEKATRWRGSWHRWVWLDECSSQNPSFGGNYVSLACLIIVVNRAPPCYCLFGRHSGLKDVKTYAQRWCSDWDPHLWDHMYWTPIYAKTLTKIVFLLFFYMNLIIFYSWKCCHWPILHSMIDEMIIDFKLKPLPTSNHTNISYYGSSTMDWRLTSLSLSILQLSLVIFNIQAPPIEVPPIHPNSFGNTSNNGSETRLQCHS